MSTDLFDPFDEEINEEAETTGNVAAFASLTVGPRDWTVDTILDQIKKRNFELDPSFQRRNAWNDQKRSRFIESLIIGVPIPQIVLAEQPKERAKFLVIDGKQRLLTLAGLRLPEYNFWDRPRFRDLNTITQLNNVKISTFLESPEFEEQRRLLSNAPIRCAVVSGATDNDVFYDIFYRLNSGAVPLSGQELRQVFYRGEFARYLFEVTSTIGPIHEMLSLRQPDPRLFDIELLLRYFAICMSLVPYRGDLRAYLDTTMDIITKDWARYRDSVEKLYAELNELLPRLNAYLGDGVVGRRFTGTRMERRFNKAVFEVQVYYFRLVPPNRFTAENKDRFLDGFRELCNYPDFRSSIEATTKSIPRFMTRFDMFRDLINGVYGLDLGEAPAVAE